jgi:hypothetical protein
MENNDTEKKPVILDGAPVSPEKLEEAKENKATKVIETAEGDYKTLHRLRG